MAKAALVTGASAGLGAELARLFAADKAIDRPDVVLVARRRDRLEELARELTATTGRRAHVVPVDLASGGAAEHVAAEVAKRGLEVEYLVNDAGFGATGPFVDLDPARALDLIHVNVTAVVHLTRIFLRPMLDRKRGRVLNVGSTAGFQPGPFMAVYYASKAFVNSFTEALWFELRETGVTATLCCPGPVTTEFAGVAGNGRSRLFRMGAMGAREVSTQAYRAMMRGRPMVIPGLRNKIGLQSLRVAPRAIVRRLAASLNQGDTSEV